MTLQPRHFGLALLLHALLLTLLFTGVQCSHQVPPPPMVQGVLINPSTIPHPAAPSVPAPQTAPQPTQPPLKTDVIDQQAQDLAARAREQQQALEQQQAALEQQQKQKELEQQQKEDEQRKAEAQRQQQIAAEAQRQAELKQQDEAQRKAAEELQRQQQAEAQKLAAQQAQAELQKQLDAEASKRAAVLESKRRAKAEAERKQAQAELQDQLGVEVGQIRQQEQLSWAQLLVMAIEKVWSRPVGVNRLFCTIHIDLAPTGQVLNATIKTSSGNSLFDNSAVSAVYAASPLPLPEDKSAFDSSINILYDPDKAAPQ